MTEDVEPPRNTAAEGMGILLAFCGFVGLGLLSLWEVFLGSPAVVLFATAGFVLLVGLFAAVEGGR